MSEFHTQPEFTLHLGDCREVMATLEPGCVDAVVSDPPYGLSFMGKGWDHGVPGVPFWTEAMRLLKPGGHLLAFGGTRTYHRLACAIEDAGFEVRDCLMWVYGSGFPKSLDVSKAIDKAAGVDFVAEPASGVGFMNAEGEGGYNVTKNRLTRCGDATPAAQQWDGWGTALKPAVEPVVMARKPLDGTVAANVLAHGTGGINVDGCRVGVEQTTTVRSGHSGDHGIYGSDARTFSRVNPPGRWPSNLIHDGSEEVVGCFPETTDGVAGKRSGVAHVTLHGLGPSESTWGGYGGSGSAARFFYCAKASKADRDDGLDGLDGLDGGTYKFREDGSLDGKVPVRRNHHPTVKPTALMAYLCRLVTPPGGVVLDPFMGSGSTGRGAIAEGFRFIGIEQDPEYIEIARRRIQAKWAPDATPQPEDIPGQSMFGFQ